jgi:hypothetical protein
MLGKSAWPRRARLAIAVAACMLLVATTACPHNVAQDVKTGNDGKVKGARTIELENGEGRARGIVTYPGGDRVDWKVIELPKDKTGVMSVRLSWVAPRPGLGLGVDVFDEFGRSVKSSKGGKKKSNRRSRKFDVTPARGKYFIRVYAPFRGDAGRYTLKVSFAEEVADLGFDLKSIEIPDPPRLAAVPAPEIECDENTFDKKNPKCRNVCPNPPDPSWAACSGKCPMVPDVNNPACWSTMPCPNPPDRRVKACPKTMWPECNPQMKDPQNPNCDNYRPKPVKAKVINVQVSGDGVIITVDRGQDKGVDKGWRGRILKKGSTRGLEGGEFTVTRVGKRESVGKVKLTSDQVTANPDVMLEAP